MSKVEIPSMGLPKNAAELSAFLAKTQSDVQGLAELGGVNAGALDKVAKDLELAKQAADEAKQAAFKAEEIAKAAARTAPDPAGDAAGIRGLKGMRLAFDPSKYTDSAGTAIFASQFTPARAAQFNLLSLTKREMQEWFDVDDAGVKLVERWRFLHDSISIAHTLMLAKGGSFADSYQRRGGMQSLPMWAQYEVLTKKLQLAMDTAESGAGSQWVPTGVGTSLIEDIRPDLELARYIEMIPMPRSPYLYPVQGAHFKAYFIPEATSSTEGSNTAIGDRDLVTASVTFTAKKLAALVYHSSEIEEDSIVPLVAAIRGDLAFAIANSIENVWLNGQATTISGASSTFDTGVTFGTGATADDRGAWDGLRYFASLTGKSEDAGSGLTVEMLTSLKGQLGKYGKKAAEGCWVTSYRGWAKFLTLKDSGGTSLLLTQDKAGSRAVIDSGALGELLGSPVVVCDDYSEALNATGVIDGAGTKTSALYFNRRRFRHGEVRVATIEASREFRFSTDQMAVKVTYRGQGQAVATPSSTEKSVGAILNL